MIYISLCSPAEAISSPFLRLCVTYVCCGFWLTKNPEVRMRRSMHHPTNCCQRRSQHSCSPMLFICILKSQRTHPATKWTTEPQKGSCNYALERSRALAIPSLCCFFKFLPLKLQPISMYSHLGIARMACSDETPNPTGPPKSAIFLGDWQAESNPTKVLQNSAGKNHWKCLPFQKQRAWSLKKQQNEQPKNLKSKFDIMYMYQVSYLLISIDGLFDYRHIVSHLNPCG